jgi:hypothetical protein
MSGNLGQWKERELELGNLVYGLKASSLIVVGVITFIGLGFALPVILDQINSRNKTVELIGEIPEDITLYITSDYGRNLLGNGSFDPDLGLTAMEMLRNITDIETRYGGLFVNGAYGLKSNMAERLDWFYYVNGAYMDRGLASYKPKRGEVVQVDYHYWGNYAASPGFLTGYPWRFLTGLGGNRWNITVASGEQYLGNVSVYAGKLSTFCNLTVEVLNPDEVELKDTEKNLVLFVGPDGNALYSEIMAIRKNAFWPVEVDKGGVFVNHLPSGRDKLEGGYVLVSTDLPGGKWALLVIATSKAWMNEAIGEISNFEIPGLYTAILVNSEGITPIPVLN